MLPAAAFGFFQVLWLVLASPSCMFYSHIVNDCTVAHITCVTGRQRPTPGIAARYA
jgi:hypothetical protein